MFDVRFRGKLLTLSKEVSEELMNFGADIENCKEILETGYEPRKRRRGKIERWMDKGNKTFNVVIVEGYDEILKEECWVIIHFGRLTKFWKRDQNGML